MPATSAADLIHVIMREGKLTLIPLSEDHVTPKYVEWLKDPEVNRYLETRWEHQTLSSVLDYVQRINASPKSYLWGLFVDDVGHIGNIKLGPINDRHLYADVSYFIGDKTHWRKGYATAAVRLVSQFAFKQLKLHRVQAGAYEQNIGSVRVLRKAGFSYEGRMFRQLRTDLGWSDHLFFGLTAEANIL